MLPLAFTQVKKSASGNSVEVYVVSAKALPPIVMLLNAKIEKTPIRVLSLKFVFIYFSLFIFV